MNHRDASLQLTEYAAGKLGADEAVELREHIEGCAECREALETYIVLSEALRCDAQLASGRLAEYAVRSEELPEGERREVEAHLEGCEGCREDLGLIAEALQEGREPVPAPPVPIVRRSALAAVPRRWALAATLLLVSLAVAATLFRGKGTEADRNGVLDAPIVADQVVDGDRASLLVTSRIENGADLTVEATETVALGNGLSVASGASLTILLKPENANGNGAEEAPEKKEIES